MQRGFSVFAGARREHALVIGAAQPSLLERTPALSQYPAWHEVARVGRDRGVPMASASQGTATPASAK